MCYATASPATVDFAYRGRYARLAGEAADKWKFAPTDERGSRVWLLRFEFTRDGATVDVNRT